MTTNLIDARTWETAIMPQETRSLTDRRKAYLDTHGWKYHAESGFWWTVRGTNKYRSHETVLIRLQSDDFVFLVKTPEKSGCACAPLQK